MSSWKTFRTGCVLISLFCTLNLQGESVSPNTVSDARLQWWREARFGMFVHWGPISIKGTEIGWSRAGERRDLGNRGTEVPVEVYDNLYKQFNPTNFNATDWVAIAKAAGMKYLVFTAKHHDGFCEFDSKFTDYKITRSPFGRDVCAELAAACHKNGIRLGFYFSPPDWYQPDFFTTNHARYVTYLHNQVRELLSNYAPVDILWFDTDGGINTPETWDAPKLMDTIHQIQPNIIMTKRCGGIGDFDTPEQRIGAYQPEPWETCMTICRQWAWKPDDDMKSLKECLQTLILCAGGDGNLLFNVGPRPDGTIEPRQVERLKEMGAWLGENGESIYGTRGGPWKPSKTVASTRKGNTIFLHVLRRTETLELTALPCPVKSATLLNGAQVKFNARDNRLVLTIDKAALNEIDTVIRLELDGSAMGIPAVNAFAAPEIKASASNVYLNQAGQYGPQAAFDNDPQTRWATDAGTKQAWITADLGKPLTVTRVRIQEALEQRVRKFEFQYRDGDAWKTIFAGQTIGESFQQKFDPVHAREFRLNILDATEGPTITDIELAEQ